MTVETALATDTTTSFQHEFTINRVITQNAGQCEDSTMTTDNTFTY